MKPEEVEVGMVVCLAGHPTELMTVATSVYMFDGQPFVTCKAGRRGVPRMVALSLLEPAQTTNQKGDPSNG